MNDKGVTRHRWHALMSGTRHDRAHDPNDVAHTRDLSTGLASIARNTPSAQRNDRNRQVSWLPGHHCRPTFPRHAGRSGLLGGNSPVTVAGTAPDCIIARLAPMIPGSLLIPSLGTCYPSVTRRALATTQAGDGRTQSVAGSALDWLSKQSAESAPAVVTIAASIFGADHAR